MAERETAGPMTPEEYKARIRKALEGCDLKRVKQAADAKARRWGKKGKVGGK